MNVQFCSKFLNNFSQKRNCNLLSFLLSILPVISIVFCAKKIRKYLIFFDRNSKEILLRKLNAHLLPSYCPKVMCSYDVIIMGTGMATATQADYQSTILAYHYHSIVISFLFLGYPYHIRACDFWAVTGQ